MGFKENLVRCREGFAAAVSAGDCEGAVYYADVYSAQLEGMLLLVRSYNDRVTLGTEIKRYRDYAMRIRTEGVCPSLRDELALDAPADSCFEGCPSNNSENKSDSVSTGEWVVDVFRQRLPSVVRLLCRESEGTGFYISEDGLLLTNHHVVFHGGRTEKQIRVESSSGELCGYASLLASDQFHDVALLRVPVREKRTVPVPFIQNYGAVTQAQSVLLIGNALGHGLAPVSGIVKHVRDKSVAGGSLIYTALSNNGDSGSPVFNRRGECIGIHKSSTTRFNGTEVRGFSNATPADVVAELVAEWKRDLKI